MEGRAIDLRIDGVPLSRPALMVTVANAAQFGNGCQTQVICAAIERLGAKLDGILRSHQLLPDGSRRDTAVYSILDIEWPAVRANLRHRLTRARSS